MRIGEGGGCSRVLWQGSAWHRNTHTDTHLDDGTSEVCVHAVYMVNQHRSSAVDPGAVRGRVAQLHVGPVCLAPAWGQRVSHSHW